MVKYSVTVTMQFFYIYFRLWGHSLWLHEWY